MSKSRFTTSTFGNNKSFNTTQKKYGFTTGQITNKKDSNILRFEFSLSKSILKKLKKYRFNISELTVESLCSKPFRVKLEEVLISEYKSIKKNEFTLDRLNVINSKTFQYYLMQMGIQHVGYGRLLDELNLLHLKFSAKFKYHKKRCLVKKLEDINNSSNTNKEASLLSELNLKIEKLQNTLYKYLITK